MAPAMLIPFVAGVALAVAAQAALPPDVKLSAETMLAISNERRGDYLAGMADGLAMGAFEDQTRMRQLRWCMNGFPIRELAALIERHGAELAGPQAHAYSGAALAGRVMARECQLQWGPPR